MELCEDIDVDPAPYLKKTGRQRAPSTALRKAELKRAVRAAAGPPSKSCAPAADDNGEEKAPDDEWTPAEAPMPVFEVEAHPDQSRLIYREPHRFVEVGCPFEVGQPRIQMHSIKDWRFPDETRTEPVTELDKAIILGRLAEACMGKLGLTGMQFAP